MINIFEVNETNKMIDQENLDVRTITMGISLMDCMDSDLTEVNRKVYEKITKKARHLVATGEEIETEYGIPIVNKRISVTPIALVGSAACKTSEDYVTLARTLDRAAKEVGVNFIGGYSALVSKGNDSGGGTVDPFYSSGLGLYGESVQFRECGLYKDGYQYGRCETDGRDDFWRLRRPRRRRTLLAVQSWWSFVTLRMTIHLWQGPFMGSQRLILSSM